MDDKYNALTLEKLGSELTSDILQLLRASQISNACYAFKIRVKTESRLLEKVGRKLKEKPNYKLGDITDVVGLRLVALFKNDMLDLFEKVIDSIRNMDNVLPNPFRENSIEEIVIYKGTSAFDDLTPKLMEIANKSCPGIHVKEKNSKEGYSSIHLVARLNKNAEHLSQNGQDYYIPIETQIRTVFEDAWGEIDHKYGYVIREGKETGLPINNPESVLSHLKVLKKFADACMEYSECIRQEAMRVPKAHIANTNVISVDSDDDIIIRFDELGVDKALVDRYIEGRKNKEEANQHRGISASKGNEELVDVAEAFRELYNDVSNDGCDENPEAIWIFSYYVRMNEAICLLSTNEADYVRMASRIYENLEPEYPDFPLLKNEVRASIKQAWRNRAKHTEA